MCLCDEAELVYAENTTSRIGEYLEVGGQAVFKFKSFLLCGSVLVLLASLLVGETILAQGSEGKVEVQSTKVVPVTSPTGDIPMNSGTGDTVVLEVQSGSVRFLRDGIMEVDGAAAFRPIQTPPTTITPLTPTMVAKTTVIPATRPAGLAPTDTCYIHYGWYNVGTTSVERATSYCVNGSGNEVVTKLVMKNTGSNVSPLLYDEKLYGNNCPNEDVLRWTDGSLQYRLNPGTAVEWQPWVEMFTGWGQTFKVIDVWEPGSYYNCIGE